MTPPLPLLDIREPAAVGWWPPAPGWWLLAVATLLLIAAALWWWKRRRRHGRLRRIALAEAERLFRDWQRSGDTQAYCTALNALLKRTALASCSRPGLARLSGRAWLDFLDAGLKRSRFGAAALAGFADPYAAEPTIDAPALHRAAADWIRGHRC